MLMNKQSRVTPKRGLPVDRTDESQKVVNVSGETVQLQYLNSGVLTNDAGEAAGTIVVGKLAYGLILDSIGSQLGGFEDSSLSFTCDAFTNELKLDPTTLEAMDYMTLEDKLNGLLENASDGDYYVDYRNGVIYGKKDTTTSTMTSVSYKISSNAASVTLEAGDIQIGNVGLLNVAEVAINPSTEEKQDDIITEIAKVSSVPDTLTGGEKTVTATGTAEALGTTLTTKSIYIRAKSTNTGNVYIGDSLVDATTNKQIILTANESITINIANRSTVYIDVDVDGEGVDYLAIS